MPTQAEWGVKIKEVEDRLNAGSIDDKKAGSLFSSMRDFLKGDPDLDPFQKIEVDQQFAVILDSVFAPIPSVAHTVEKHINAIEQTRALNYLLTGSTFNLRSIDWSSINSPEELEAERMRLTQEMYPKIIAAILGALIDNSSNLMVADFSIARDVTFTSNDPHHPTIKLFDLFFALPRTISVDLGAGITTYPFLEELYIHLDTLMNVCGRIFAGASTLRSYPSESAFVEKINSDQYQKGFFDRQKFYQFLTFETNDGEGLRKLGLESGKNFFSSLRKVLSQLYKLTNLPTNAADLAIYSTDFKPYNCFPIDHLTTDPGIADTKTTLDWVRAQVGGDMSEEMFLLAFRTAFAYIRATGEEEYFDRRADIHPETGDIRIKLYAFRKASTMFDTINYTRNSIDAKGSARDPVSTQFAERHPAIALPIDKLLVVDVETSPGVYESMQIFEVIRQNLWDRVKKDPTTVAESPAGMYGAFLNQAILQVEGFWKMFGKAVASILPDPEKITITTITRSVPTDTRLADILKEIPLDTKMISKKDAHELLQRMHLTDRAMYDPQFQNQVYGDLLFTVSAELHDLPQNTANQLKDVSEYYFGKLPRHMKIIEEMFQTPTGDAPIVEAFMENDAAGNPKPDTDFMTMALFFLMLRAELERYSFTKKAKETSRNQFAKSKIFLGEEMETKGRKKPLSYPQRRAIELFLLNFFDNLPPNFKQYTLDLQGIRDFFKDIGIEGNEATNYSDLQQLLMSDKAELRKAVKVKSASIAGVRSPVLRFMSRLGEALSGDENVR